VFGNSLIETGLTGIGNAAVFQMVLICTLVIIICTALGITLARKINGTRGVKNITGPVN
jgi:hypothetical protein